MRNQLSLLLLLAAPVVAQPMRIVVENLNDLRACLSKPPGQPLVCALRGSPSPYDLSGEPLTIRRSDTTIEGVAGPGEDPPTLKRTDPAQKQIIWVPRTVSNVTIRKIQFDGNVPIAPGQKYFEISAEGSHITVADSYFGNSTFYCMYIGGSDVTIHGNTFGKLMVGGSLRQAPGNNAAIKAWGANATHFAIESNQISDYRIAISITDVPNGSDPAAASVIANNTIYHHSVYLPDEGGGQIYVAGSTNVKVTNNKVNGGWAEAENHDTVHSYGIEVDRHASHVYIGSNEIFNNSISGMWIGNGSNHITVENDRVYNNGLNGVQIAGNDRLAPVSDVSIIGLKASHNDLHRGPRAPYPTLPRFWGVMIQNPNRTGVCIQNDSDLAENSRGAVHSDVSGAYSSSGSCPRPYN
jgi:hypothetical protein